MNEQHRGVLDQLHPLGYLLLYSTWNTVSERLEVDDLWLRIEFNEEFVDAVHIKNIVDYFPNRSVDVTPYGETITVSICLYDVETDKEEEVDEDQ